MKRLSVVSLTRVVLSPKPNPWVATVVGMAADGMTTIDIPAAYPDLEREDIQEALHDAANAVRERELPLMAP